MRLALSLLTLFGIPATAALVACGSDSPNDVPTSHASRTDAGSVEGASSASPDGASPDPAPLTATFTLIDTSVTTDPTGSPLPGFDPISNGAVISLQQTGQWVSLRANLSAATTVGTAVFVLDGSYIHVDTAAPFTMCGAESDTDAGADADTDAEGGSDAAAMYTFLPCPLTDGKHDLTLTLYAPQAFGGELLSVTQFQFGIASSDYDGGAFDQPDADAGDDDASGP